MPVTAVAQARQPTPRPWERARHYLCTTCPACRLMFRARGVPCIRHTLPSERTARAKAIGVVR